MSNAQGDAILDIQAVKASVEAALLASERPLTLAQLASALEGTERKLVHQVLDELRAEYDSQARGFRLAEIAEGWQLLTRPQHAGVIRRLYRVKAANRLTRPALETLAIIAYKQPLTKAEIEAIRGVGSDGVMQNILERRLVRTVGRKDAVGRPLLYGTTREFLQAFGLKDLAELPKLTELKDLLKQEPEGDLWEVGEDGKLQQRAMDELSWTNDGPFAPAAAAGLAPASAADSIVEDLVGVEKFEEVADEEDEDDDDEDEDEEDEDEDEEDEDEDEDEE
ncbi:MAG TPA: SMC-Scp complex subunit ScpB, partial [bacterium]|nr:SMC-Scp complex subunit ScpB [bacterium]